MEEQAKKVFVSPSIISRDMEEITDVSGNIYVGLNVMGKRANQLALVQKDELTDKLAQFASPIDNLEEIFENREQIEISRYYERLPKSVTIATEEFIEGKVYFRDNKEEKLNA